MSTLRLFGRAGAAAGAVAAAASSSTTAHARAPTHVAPQQTEHRSSVAHGKCVDDDWLVLQPQHGDIILMKPFEACEVDDAVADVAKVMQRRGGRAPRPVDLPVSSTVESGSPNSGSSTPTSEGSAADTQISATFLTASGMQASGGAWGDDQQVGGMGMDMSTLLDLTSRMLKRPGMQVELVKAMMEDREIQEILMRERGDFDAYLQAAGALPVHSLLPPAAAAASQTAVREEEEQGGLEQGEHPLAGLINAVVSALEQAGSGMGQLFGWLKGRVALLLGHSVVPDTAADAAAADAGAPGAKGSGARGAKARVVLQSVLAVAAIVVVVVLFRRGPSAGFRRAATAAAFRR